MKTKERVTDLAAGEVPSSEGVYRQADGTLFRVSTEPDQWGDLRDDEDWYGKVSLIDPRRDEQGNRPEGFDGAARKVDYREGRFWWQPPADVLADPDLLRAMRQSLVNLVDFGYKCVTVELLGPEPDYFGGFITRDCRSMGGLEPFDEIGPAVQELMGDIEELA